ncbi:MAG: aldehyde dehydrogenase family protein [Christensenella sp.]|nr:aldehyde dehydrogenase family protein [Christensenella sp.]
MAYSDTQIDSIISETLAKFQHQSPRSQGGWLCDTAEEAIANAKAAQKELIKLPLEKRGRFIEAMRKAALNNAEYLARLANEETGYGRVPDKIAKNMLAAEKTPGIEDLHAQAFTGDYGLTLVEAAPYGVIGSITPSTNPTSTVINNSISMIAAGNAVVFNPHPAAKRASQETMRILNEAIVAAGGPCCLITTVKEPTLESGKTIMESKDIPLLSVTGGEAVVSVAMRTGKKVIAAGPGNPPVIVDDTAVIKKAAKDIVDGASFDNNVVCIAEKEVFAYATIIDELVAQMQLNGAYLVSGADIDKIVNTVLVKQNDQYVINRKYVGRNAAVILKDSGVSYNGDPRLVIARVDKNHPFVRTEMLMPVLGICSVKDIDEAVEEALCAEQGRQHSAMIHSTNIKHLTYAAAALNTTVFVKNAPSYAGLGFQAEGYTTLTIATPTGEGLTSAKSFTRARRCVLHGDLRIV